MALFHEILTERLEPIRQSFLAQVILGLFESGIYAALEELPSSSSALARRLEMDEERLLAVLSYSRHEGLVEEDGDRFRITQRLRDYAPFLPWFQLLVGGYHETLVDLQTTVRNATAYGARDLKYVGRGSAGISRHDTLPAVLQLLTDLSIQLDCVVDIGCSDACYLVTLCEHGLVQRGIGVEANADSVAQAQSYISDHGLSHRIEVLNIDAQAYFETARPAPDCYIAAFVLQELLAQSGRPYVISLLRTMRHSNPHAHVLVIEVDFDAASRQLSRGLGRAYYNPYFLVHSFTKQRLLPRVEWKKLFSEAGYDVLATAHPPVEVDPTRLGVCFMLGRAADARLT